MTDLLRELLARLQFFFRKRERDEDFDAEITTHLEMLIQENQQRGMSAEGARRAALISIGGLEQAKEQHRDNRGLPLLETLVQDIRYCFRTLRRDAGLAVFAILIVGLGAGASSTVFSVLNALLLRPLPFTEPDRLIWIENNLGHPDRSARTIQVGHLLALRSESRLLSDVAGYFSFAPEGGYLLRGAREPERLTGLGVTEGFFPLLGVHPHMGRHFSAEECKQNGPKAVLLSHGTWERSFAADPGIVGHAVTINQEAVTVVGVLPASFDFASVFQPGTPVDLFTPYPLSPQTERQGNTLFLVGRLKAGATMGASISEMNGLAERARRETTQNRFVPNVTTLREHVSGRYRLPMVVLAWAVGLVMLIVCANLSNLLLSRAAVREKEISVRAALGADRGRLVRQMLTESLVLSSGGAALGLVLAISGARFLAGLDTVSLPLRELVRVDATVLGFTLLAAIGTGIAFGVAPAMRASALALGQPLRESGRGSTSGRRHGRIRDALVVSEVALASVLLVGSGLLLRSFLSLIELDPGFQPGTAVAVRIDPNTQYSKASREPNLQYFSEALRRVRSAPGVTAAGVIDSLPLGRNRTWSVQAKGSVYARDEEPSAYLHVVSEGYLSAMGIPLLAGRDFSESDHKSSGAVVLVNQTLAQTLWPGQDPIGRVLVASHVERQVIGVVQDVRHLDLEREGGAEMYFTVRQTGDYASMHLVARGARSLTDLITATREAIHPVDPSLPLKEIHDVQGIVDRSISPRRLILQLLAGFAGFALILASLGIYAVISYSVSQRRREIGIRIALGAQRRDLQVQIVIQAMKLAAMGMALGCVASLGAGHVMRALLFGVAPSDPMTFAGALAGLTAVALLAGYIPARRASRMDPVEALRAD
ncbi:MAG: ABC transporter permease [Bryobacteraceae bacterium]|nr:ABC transporter permease [Bryobacteraceae bacterium]